MEDNNSTTSIIRASDYLSLLQQIDKLTKLSTDWSNSDHVSKETCDISAIEAIFEELTDSIKRISKMENFRKNALLCITILNTILRLSATEGFNDIISRDSFQSMFNELKTALKFFIDPVMDGDDSVSVIASEMMNSMLLNLVKNNLIETCFTRLLSNNTPCNKGKMFYDLHC